MAPLYKASTGPRHIKLGGGQESYSYGTWACVVIAGLVLCVSFGFLAGSFHHHVNVLPQAVKAAQDVQAAQEGQQRRTNHLPVKPFVEAAGQQTANDEQYQTVTRENDPAAGGTVVVTPDDPLPAVAGGIQQAGQLGVQQQAAAKAAGKVSGNAAVVQQSAGQAKQAGLLAGQTEQAAPVVQVPDGIAVQKKKAAPLVQKKAAPLVQKQKVAPLVQKKAAPLVQKQKVAPLVQKKAAAPAFQVIKVAPAVQKLSGIAVQELGDKVVEAVAACLNTCPTARNGVCDDGRGAMPNAPRDVLCDLGTDCEDCGPWHDWSHTLLPPRWLQKDGQQRGPIAELLAMGKTVRVRRTDVDMSKAQSGSFGHMDFAYGDPAADHGVSRSMDQQRHVDLSLTKLIHVILQGRCLESGKGRRVVVDVGAGFGWFATFAAIYGCKVIAYEPVPMLRQFLEYNAALNNVSHLVEIRTDVMGFQNTEEVDFVVPRVGPWQDAGITGLMLDEPAKAGGVDTMRLGVSRLDNLGGEALDILLLHVSTSGFDAKVLWGGMQLLLKKSVQHIVTDYSPGVLFKNNRYTELKEGLHLLDAMIILGYRIGHVDDVEGHKEPQQWQRKLSDTPFSEVTRHNLAYDLHDTEQLIRTALGCPMPAQLHEKFPASWQHCNMVPEDLNPRSFHSVAYERTTLWASLHHDMMPLHHSASILGMATDETVWRPQATRAQCQAIPPASQVRNRCPCTDLGQCGVEQAMVEGLAREHSFPSNYVLKHP